MIRSPSFASFAPLRETRPRKVLRAKPPSTQSEKNECISIRAMKTPE